MTYIINKNYFDTIIFLVYKMLFNLIFFISKIIFYLIIYIYIYIYIYYILFPCTVKYYKKIEL